jgi:hypothetical protein
MPHEMLHASRLRANTYGSCPPTAVPQHIGVPRTISALANARIASPPPARRRFHTFCLLEQA